MNKYHYVKVCTVSGQPIKTFVCKGTDVTLVTNATFVIMAKTGTYAAGVVALIPWTIRQFSARKAFMMFRWKPEGRYRCRKSMAITPLWFSTTHGWAALTPYWLWADELKTSTNSVIISTIYRPMLYLLYLWCVLCVFGLL